MKKNKIKTLTVIFAFLISSLMIGYIPSINNSTLHESIDDTDQIEKKNKDDNEDRFEDIKPSGIEDWWNNTFRYRVEVELTEPGYFKRVFEPVDVDMTFDNGKCHKDAIRVVEYIPSTKNEEIYSQVWDIDLYSSTEFVQSCTITFLANVDMGATKSYYIYYSDNGTGIYNPEQRYLAGSQISSTFDDINDQLSISTPEFSLEMKKDSGIYNFTKDGRNYHTNYSLMPWIANGELNNSIYHPDSDGGHIPNWMVTGPFQYQASPGDYWSRVTGNNYHLDVKNQYVLGDYALGGDLAPQYLDESEIWEYVDFSTQPTYTEYYGGYLDLNYWAGGTINGAPSDVCIYSSCYIRSPVDLDAYLKVGSDDGIQIWRDGVRIHNNPVLRPPRADREIANNGEALHFNAGQWYYFIVLIEERGGHMGFHFRFSENSQLYSNPSNDLDDVENLDIALQPPFPLIVNISKVSDEEIGPVFERYEIDWETSGDMHITDKITVYDDFTLWKTERTFWWDYDHTDMQFSVLSTFYNNSDEIFDRYFYDNTWSSGISSPPTNVENYTVIWNASVTDSISLGTFISDFDEGGSLSIDALYWGIYYNSSDKLINMCPGNYTNLDNDAGGSNNYATITFWEYVNDTAFAGNSEANDTFAGVYNSLKHPLIQSKASEDKIYFDLKVTTEDHDRNLVEGVKVLIYNKSAPIRKLGYEYGPNQTTNEEGTTTFLRLMNGTYILNFTFSDNLGEFFVKTNIEVILNQDKNVTVTHLNLTSLYLKLYQRGNPSQAIVGANVTFYYTRSGVREYPIRSETSNDLGEVLFVWRNMSTSEANVSVRVGFLGDPDRVLNDTADYWEFTFFERNDYELEVTTAEFSTTLINLEPGAKTVTNKFKGDTIYYKVWYYYTEGGTDKNITGAAVTYSIVETATQEEKLSGQLDPVIGEEGKYDMTLDTSDPNLITSVPYEITITAYRPGYTLKENETSITLRDIWTNLTAVGVPDPIEVPWEHNLTLNVYYNDTLNGDIGLDDSVVSYSVPGKPAVSGALVESATDGWYYLNINSTMFGEIGTYTLSIIAYKTNYELQEIFIDIDITVIHSSLTPSASSITKNWAENFSLTVTFTDTDNSKFITDGTITYLALGTYPPVEGEFKNLEDGTYLLTLNTTAFPYAASYFLRVTATKTNYETQSLDISIDILPIPTTINGEDAVVEEVEVTYGTSETISFNYRVDGGAGILGAIVTYKWNYDGGSFESGTLSAGASAGRYILDFDTEDRETGGYSLIISFGKVNYESLSATIFLEIIEREIDVDLSAKTLQGEKIDIEGDIIETVKGDTVVIQIELIDKTDDEPLTDADVILTIGEKEFEFEEVDDGVYEYEFSTQEYEAFFASETITGEITIEKDNYESETVDITIVIGMEEIFPGIPTFYFMMITGAIVGVVGSLVTYRYIQIARIPKFVKKVKKIRKAIKSKDNISESLLYPSKEDYMVKYIGDRWNVLGLSLKDNIGTKDKITKQGGDIK